MKTRLPALDVCKKVLGFSPNETQCLPKGMSDTIENLSDVIVYIRPKDGGGFWYYMNYFEKNKIYGYKMLRDRWIYYVIREENISSYY